MTMRRALAIAAGLWLSAAAASAGEAPPGPARPNILLVYADDLGYGDVSSYGAKSLRTPRIDSIAERGLRFVNAHSPSATCTPSRYALLTGEYAWRQKGTSVLPGDAGLVVAPGRTTLASMLRRAGYATGVVGKWHLGLGEGRPDWNAAIRPGPREIGFDYSFLMPATGDRVPCVYVEDQEVVGLDPRDPIRVSYESPVGNEPLGRDHPELLRMHPSHGHDQAIVNGISRIGYMSGGRSARWVDEDMADTFARKAVAFLERHRDRPFFLYFATHDIHVPRVPHPRFAGRSGMGPRGDAILQLDATVGAVLDALVRLGLEERTLVVFTSDNGPVVDDGYRDQAVEKLGTHRPAGPLRGGKYSAFDGGTRVPFVVRWPGRVAPGVSDALVGQVDLLSSLAALVGQPLAPEDAPDSFDVLPALLGRSTRGRADLVEHAGTLALVTPRFKLIAPGWGARRSRETGIELGNDPEVQLYDLADDLGETTNVASRQPEIVREMSLRLEKIRKDGRSRP
jgi:arylsulfatase A-like enzyme